jgi:hypothetical protein
MFRTLASTLVGIALISSAVAEDAVKRIEFETGKSEAILTGKLTGREDILYKLNTRDGQYLRLQMLPGSKPTSSNPFVPRRGSEDKGRNTSAAGGARDAGPQHKSGEHSSLVFQNRSGAHRGETTDYKLLARVADMQPIREEQPSNGPVPQKIIEDCLTTLRKKAGKETGMKVIRAERSENSFIIDVQVDSAEKLWRCFHDGTRCTGTEYQG